MCKFSSLHQQVFTTVGNLARFWPSDSNGHFFHSVTIGLRGHPSARFASRRKKVQIGFNKMLRNWAMAAR
jgi:hypothetical protein